jgi:hypothetical protein
MVANGIDRICLEFRSIRIRVCIFNLQYNISIRILKSHIYDIDIYLYPIWHSWHYLYLNLNLRNIVAICICICSYPTICTRTSTFLSTITLITLFNLYVVWSILFWTRKKMLLKFTTNYNMECMLCLVRLVWFSQTNRTKLCLGMSFKTNQSVSIFRWLNFQNNWRSDQFGLVRPNVHPSVVNPRTSLSLYRPNFLTLWGN